MVVRGEEAEREEEGVGEEGEFIILLISCLMASLFSVRSSLSGSLS